MFDIVFSSEVFEHVVNPEDTIKQICELTDSSGFVLFSTSLQPKDIEQIKCNWWYISPRNGHISIYTERSLEIAFDNVGMKYLKLSDEWHIASHKKSAFSSLNLLKLREIVNKLPCGFIKISKVS